MDRLISGLNQFLEENHERMPTFDRAIRVIRREHNDVLEFTPDAEHAVVFHAEFFAGSKLSLELYYLRIPHGAHVRFSHRGREYAQDVDYLVTHFFARNYRGVFHVGNDISSIQILEPMVVTRAMFTNSEQIAEKFGSDKIPEGGDMCFLEQKINRLQYFGPDKKVLRELNVGEFAALANSPNEFRSEQLGLITRYWYKVVYPQFVSRLPSVAPETSEVYFETVGLSVSLSMWSVLTNDDLRTWYMRIFQMGPCLEQESIDLREYERRVRAVRNMKVAELLRLHNRRSPEDRTIIDTMSLCYHVDPETTVGEFVMAAKRNENDRFFDYFVLMTINSSIFVQIHERLEEVGTFSPCRPIRA